MLMGLPDQWDTCSRTMVFEGVPRSLAHWGDTIAIGLARNVVLFNAITGIRTSVLCGHADIIDSLAFSQDGTLLMSGSKDTTVTVWDIQTGGVIRTFSHDTSIASGASLSPDGATVALGTTKGVVHLWDVRTGRCNSIDMYPDSEVTAIQFSPVNPQHFISSSSGGIVGQWDIDGHQIATSYHEVDKVEDLAWTRDGTRFVSCAGKIATVRDSESGVVVVKLHAPPGSWYFHLGCFSPDGRLVACAAGATIWVWDITISGSRLIGHLVGHSDAIVFLAFPSYIISGGLDQSMKFWKSSSFPMDSTTFDQMVAHAYSPVIRSINLFAEEGMLVTSDSDGVVKIWDVTTGKCTSSFSTPARGKCDTYLAGDTLIIVWCASASADADADADTAMEYNIWDVYKAHLLRKFYSSLFHIRGLKISGDGSKIFGLGDSCIAAVSMQTGEEVGRIQLEGGAGDRLFVRGSKVTIDESCRRGWDFEGLGVPDFGEFPDGPQLDLVGWKGGRDIKPCWMEDTMTKRSVFRLSEKYVGYGRKIEWDGRYLLNWSPSEGDIVIMDFGPLCP